MRGALEPPSGILTPVVARTLAAAEVAVMNAVGRELLSLQLRIHVRRGCEIYWIIPSKRINW